MLIVGGDRGRGRGEKGDGGADSVGVDDESNNGRDEDGDLRVGSFVQILHGECVLPYQIVSKSE